MEQKKSTRAPSANWILACSVDRQNTIKSIILLYYGGVCHALDSTNVYTQTDRRQGVGQ